MCPANGGGVSDPSPPLTVPLAAAIGARVPGVPREDQQGEQAGQDNSGLWQQDFELQYIELEEVGRGRVAVVRRCQVCSA